MKYLNEFRNPHYAKALAALIAKEAHADQQYLFMEFCGGHTHAIHRYGIPSLLPANVELIHGPGCPVCILPLSRIDKALALSAKPNVILCSYGDMLRVPGSHRQTLLTAKAGGADIRMVYSVQDALAIAIAMPDKNIVFFAIGFETTTPATAHAILEAKKLQLSNFSVFCNHVLTPVALECLLQSQANDPCPTLQGFIGPAHVSIIIGSKAYEAVCQKYRKPMVIAGFEPIDVLHAILLLIRQINHGVCKVEIQYCRAVTETGNGLSQQLIREVFALRDTFEWRGLGFLANSALKIKENYREFDAERRYTLNDTFSKAYPGCQCGAILRGLKKPQQCALFAKVCTPDNALGSCMVSSEGACAAVYAYSRVKC